MTSEQADSFVIRTDGAGHSTRIIRANVEDISVLVAELTIRLTPLGPGFVDLVIFDVDDDGKKFIDTMTGEPSTHTESGYLESIEPPQVTT